MSLNIKDPEAYRLAAAISQATGETMTRERLQSQRGKVTVEELLAIAKRSSALVKGSYLDHAEFLYDEHGLPK